MSSKLGRFLECQKCYIIYVTCVVWICLMCPHSPSGAAHPWAHAYMLGKSPYPCYICNLYIPCKIFMPYSTSKVMMQELQKLFYHDKLLYVQVDMLYTSYYNITWHNVLHRSYCVITAWEVPYSAGAKQLLFTVSPIAILYNYVNVYSNVSRKTTY